jgi:hypothetical protein
MALSSKKHEPFFVTTGTGKDKADTDNLTNMTAAWAAEKAEGCKTYLADPALGPIIYQLQQMQDEIDYLRTEISANKDKTGITTSQANAITANTAKTSMTLGTTGSTALAGDTRIPAFTADDTSVANTTKSTAITFGNFTTTVAGKGRVYSLPITVIETTVSTKGGQSFTSTLTKTATLTLT